MSAPAPHRSAAALVALVVLLAACTGADEEPEAQPAADVETEEAAADDEVVVSELAAGYEGEPHPMGTEDPGIPEEIPELIPTTPFPTVEPEHLLVYEDFGLQQGAIHLVDVAGGAQLGYLNMGQADFWAILGGEAPMGISAPERFRPRGARGQIEALATFYDADGEVTGEVLLPRTQYASAGGGNRALSSDGRYLYLPDTILNGLVVVDTEAQELVGELATHGCSAWKLVPIGPDTVYKPCWRSGEVLEITVADGEVAIADQVQAFEEDAQIHNDILHAEDAGMMLLLTRFDEVIAIDLSDGLPDEVSEPVDIAREGETVVQGSSYVSDDYSVAIVGFADGEDYTEDVERYVVFDPADWSEVGELALPEGVDDPDDMLLSPDGSVMYILANDAPLPPEAADEGDEAVAEGAEEDEPETGSVLFAVDVASGEVTAPVVLETTRLGRSFTSLFAPVAVDG